ncbi:hypothetical protein [Maribacter stanieri]|uniref:hypothetical protein n=1 Tax=Maribacter stanieri TaxID=440514 RepID=UPI0030D96FEA|tara:strand:- start:10553 stop:10957 length:405 start_codon:yes stop_codon:yes gene_type:complete
MITLQEYFLNKDSQIKGIVLSFAGYKKLLVAFKGYYIEDNNITGSFPPQPFYESYKNYREENAYAEIDHIRYFFELSNGNKSHTLTIHLNGKEMFDVSFSIEELGQGFEDSTPEMPFKESDFSQLMNLIKQKFD